MRKKTLLVFSQSNKKAILQVPLGINSDWQMSV